MAESDTQEKKKDLENTKELVDEFEGILNAEIRQQKREEYKRSELPGKYMATLLYGWDTGNFEKEYLRKLEKNWYRWKTVSLEEKP